MTRVSNNLLKDAGTTGKALLGATTASAARTTLGLATVASSGDYNDLLNKPSGGGGSYRDPVYSQAAFEGDDETSVFYGVFPSGIGAIRNVVGESWNPPTSSVPYTVSVGGVIQRPTSFEILFTLVGDVGPSDDAQQGTIIFGEPIPLGYAVTITIVI
jgi:hypothetical protein